MNSFLRFLLKVISAPGASLLGLVKKGFDALRSFFGSARKLVQPLLKRILTYITSKLSRSGNRTGSDALERLKKAAEDAMKRAATETADEPEPAADVEAITVEPETVVAVEPEPAVPVAAAIAVEPMTEIAVDEMAVECAPRVVTCPQEGNDTEKTAKQTSKPAAPRVAPANDTDTPLVPLLRRFVMRIANQPSKPVRPVPSVLAG